ncbi:hypothetical protein D1872_280210 [compost metagenome]
MLLDSEYLSPPLGIVAVDLHTVGSAAIEMQYTAVVAVGLCLPRDHTIFHVETFYMLL